MRVQVNVKHSAEALISASLELVVKPGDTVLAVRERISVVVPTPFPEQQHVFFNSAVLPDEQSLGDCGVTEKSTLELVVQATEEAFVNQLASLLQDQALDAKEIGLLYAYKFGVSVSDALRALASRRPRYSFTTELQKFMERQKRFLVEPNGRFSLAVAEKKPHASLLPLHTINEQKSLVVGGQINVRVTVNVLAPGHEITTSNIENLALKSSDTVAQLKERVALVESLPFPEQSLSLWTSAGEVVLENGGAALESCGVEADAHLVLTVNATEEAFVRQLVEILEMRGKLSPNELSSLYCYRHGVTTAQALKTLGLRANFRRFLESRERFCVQGECVTLADASTVQSPGSCKSDCEAMSANELPPGLPPPPGFQLSKSPDACKSDGTVVDRKALLALETVVKHVSERSFLNIHRITKDAFGGDNPLSPSAEMFLTGLPRIGQEKWLPSLLRSAAAVLEELFLAADIATGVDVVDNTLQVLMQGNIKVTLRLSPTCDS